MTVTLSKPGFPLRSALREYPVNASPAQETFFFDGDAATTDFTLSAGWKPKNVFVDGALMRPGSGEDYTVSFDGHAYTVAFAVAPAAVDIGVMAVREG